MTTLALRSLRHRPAAAIATFLAVLLGTALVGCFAMLVETALSVGGSPANSSAANSLAANSLAANSLAANSIAANSQDRTNLFIMGGVVGGWGAIIVLYTVAA